MPSNIAIEDLAEVFDASLADRIRDMHGEVDFIARIKTFSKNGVSMSI